MTKTMILQRLVAGCCALFAALSFAADNTITNVEVGSVSADKQLIKVSFSGTVPSPTSFSVNTPPRIAFDFANTTSQFSKNAIQVNGSALRVVNIAEGNGRTRLVLNLQKQATYQTQVDGNSLIITVDGGQAAVASAQASTKFAESRPSNVEESIKNVDFRRGNAGEGKVVVDLSTPNIGIDIRQQGKTLVVDFAKASLPKTLERRLDVTDFGTPIQKVDTYGQAGSTRMVIEPKGNWEYSAYQTENRFIIEVRNAVEQTSKVGGLKPAYKGEKLSLNFQNVEIRTVLQVIAEFTGINIIESDTVTGNLTLRLKDVPWDEALDIILQAKGLDQRKSGNVMWIAPRDELAAKEKQDLEARKQIADLEPTRTEFFSLKYQKAADFNTILKDDKQKFLSARGSAVIDPRTNTLIVQDIPAKLDQVRELINKIDIPVRQVMIQARIVEASDTFGRDLGVKIGALSIGHIGNTTITTKPTLATTVNGNTVSDTNVNLPASGLGFGAPATLALLASSANWALGLELSALEADNRGRVVTSPRVITADQVEAVIEDGQEIPYSESAQNGATSIAFKKAVLSLRVTPQITPDGNVMLDVKVNKDTPGVNTTSGPAINTKQITTKVLVENGGTVVIGGIYQQDVQEGLQKVPLLGDIPVVGNMFKHRSKQDTKKEMLIFITPSVLQQDMTLR
ncbi:type IV pilus assembly protein PilQ [Andreprevotia lacus DSM 23236]|jgi:type IV pilus assembly protein PilQ|uniref:Type IV pilus assembly protein PilQ n=1 Tax=Andreprevotia lacus DSM 23236 TaxID=1121001 RepID=A0A1W1Y162_9NEIS|nr:type IV pilus secretin PilQ [Andreprevotia lacus]SMC29893.1 type IV pilus assembly protein PilQ [Andreprevotia lacus DSM 23236]